MERNEILKSAGFTEDFIRALQEFEKSVPEISFDTPFDVNNQEIRWNDMSEQLVITSTNDNYNYNLVVRQG